MGDLGIKWIEEAAGTRPVGPNFEARVVASVKALARGGFDDDLKALVAAYNTPQPATPASIFAQPGILGVRYDALAGAGELAAAGVKWISAVLSHGVNADGSHNNDADDQTNQAWLGNGGAAAYRAAGIKVLGWAWHEVRPETEAWIACQHITNYRLDGWIANAEEVWKPDSARYIVSGAERYARELQALLSSFGLGALPVAWSVLGAAVPPNVYGYDYQAFIRRGWRILPQAYPQQSPEYKLSIVIDHAVKANIPLDVLHPTIANYAPQKPGAFKPTIGEWGAELAAARTRGVTGLSYWAHDFTLADMSRLNQA